jgi:hypothetical protein
VEHEPVKMEVKVISGNTEINGVNGTKDHEVSDEVKATKEAGPIL